MTGLMRAKISSVAPTYAIQRTLPRLFRGAAEGGVGKVHASGRKVGGEAFGNRRVAGRTIHYDASGFQVRGNAGDGRGNLGRTGEAEKDDAGRGGEVFH